MRNAYAYYATTHLGLGFIAKRTDLSTYLDIISVSGRVGRGIWCSVASWFLLLALEPMAMVMMMMMMVS